MCCKHIFFSFYYFLFYCGKIHNTKFTTLATSSAWLRHEAHSHRCAAVPTNHAQDFRTSQMETVPWRHRPPAFTRPQCPPSTLCPPETPTPIPPSAPAPTVRSLFLRIWRLQGPHLGGILQCLSPWLACFTLRHGPQVHARYCRRPNALPSRGCSMLRRWINHVLFARFSVGRHFAVPPSRCGELMLLWTGTCSSLRPSSWVRFGPGAAGPRRGCVSHSRAAAPPSPRAPALPTPGRGETRRLCESDRLFWLFLSARL